jgi:hypothetical protein
MASSYLDIATTPAVRLAQEVNGSAQLYDKIATKRRSGHLSTAEAEFIGNRLALCPAPRRSDRFPHSA